MKKTLTLTELLDIEKHIEEIDDALEILDPSNVIEAQEIDRKILILEHYISLLEQRDTIPHLRLLS